jgi:hypothetical protein
MVKIELDMNMKLPGERKIQSTQMFNPQIKIPFMKDTNDDEVLFEDDVNEDNVNTLDKEMERTMNESMEIDIDKNNMFNEDLAKRDQHLLKIEDEIALRRKFLLEKQKRLDKLTRQNIFLETIKQDYETYHNYIVEQKESQIRAMNSIKQYVEDLIVSGKLTDEDIKQAKDDQREITGEVKKIREKINEIIGV